MCPTWRTFDRGFERRRAHGPFGPWEPWWWERFGTFAAATARRYEAETPAPMWPRTLAAPDSAPTMSRIHAAPLVTARPAMRTTVEWPRLKARPTPSGGAPFAEELAGGAVDHAQVVGVEGVEEAARVGEGSECEGHGSAGASGDEEDEGEEVDPRDDEDRRQVFDPHPRAQGPHAVSAHRLRPSL